MAEFLIKRGGPDTVLVSARAGKGTVRASFRARSNGTVRKVTVPDALVDAIAPEHARFLVRLDSNESAAEQPTLPATPNSKRERAEE